MAEVKDTITLYDVRISFMESLWTAKQVQGEGKPSHSANFLLDPEDPQVTALNNLIEKVARDKWPNAEKPGQRPKWETVLAMLRAKDKICLHDGNFKPQYEGYEGNYYLSARNDAKVTVVDRDRSILEESDGKPYSGCRVVANVQIWAQDHKQWGQRINATLRWVQFYEDDDAFAGAPPASVDEIPAIDEDDRGSSVNMM